MHSSSSEFSSSMGFSQLETQSCEVKRGGAMFIEEVQKGFLAEIWNKKLFKNEGFLFCCCYGVLGLVWFFPVHMN